MGRSQHHTRDALASGCVFDASVAAAAGDGGCRERVCGVCGARAVMNRLPPLMLSRGDVVCAADGEGGDSGANRLNKGDRNRDGRWCPAGTVIPLISEAEAAAPAATAAVAVVVVLVLRLPALPVVTVMSIPAGAADRSVDSTGVVSAVCNGGRGGETPPSTAFSTAASISTLPLRDCIRIFTSACVGSTKAAGGRNAIRCAAFRLLVMTNTVSPPIKLCWG